MGDSVHLSISKLLQMTEIPTFRSSRVPAEGAARVSRVSAGYGPSGGAGGAGQVLSAGAGAAMDLFVCGTLVCGSAVVYVCYCLLPIHVPVVPCSGCSG